MAARSPDEVLTPAQLTADMKGKIVVGGSFLPAETLAKRKDVGIAGLVVGGFMIRISGPCSGYD